MTIRTTSTLYPAVPIPISGYGNRSSDFFRYNEPFDSAIGANEYLVGVDGSITVAVDISTASDISVIPFYGIFSNDPVGSISPGASSTFEFSLSGQQGEVVGDFGTVGSFLFLPMSPSDYVNLTVTALSLTYTLSDEPPTSPPGDFWTGLVGCTQ